MERVRRSLAGGESPRDDAVAELRRRYTPRQQTSADTLAEIFAPQSSPRAAGSDEPKGPAIHEHPVVQAALREFSKPIERGDANKPRGTK